MSDRRKEDRPESSDRRTFPRPPLWLNLVLLLLGIGGVLFARYHRDQISTRFTRVLMQEKRTPVETKKIKEELAEMDLTRSALEKEIDGRAQFLQSLKSDDFFLSVDTQQKKLRFYYGDTILREGDITIGEGKTIKTADGSKTWTFVPVKGAFKVEGKGVDYGWQVPEWVYAMNGQPVPTTRPTIAGGLGKYVLFLPNGYVLHSAPSADSPLKGAKPGSILVSADDLAAIWQRVEKDKTFVYIF